MSISYIRLIERTNLLYTLNRERQFVIQVRASRSVVQVALPRSATRVERRSCGQAQGGDRYDQLVGAEDCQEGALGRLENTGTNQNLRLPAS